MVVSRHLAPALITDRGCQYASASYQEALEQFGLRGSMSAPISSYQNVQAESVMKTLKVAEVYLASYEKSTMRQSDCHSALKRFAASRPGDLIFGGVAQVTAL